MSGWGNDSFDAGSAGGWGDSSYASHEPAESEKISKMTNEIPIPVTVHDLYHLVKNDERIRIGNADFTKVRVVGRVKGGSMVDQQSLEYRIVDVPNSDPEEDFLVIQYVGVDGASAEPLVEGTDIAVVGKLRNFVDRRSIVTFDVREVENKKEIDAFHLEAKLAMLYYTKNVVEMIASNDLSRFDGTMLRGVESAAPMKPTEARAATNGANAQPGGSGSEQAGRTTAASGSKPGNAEVKSEPGKGDEKPKKTGDGRGLRGQQAEIYRYLTNCGKGDLGASVEDIRDEIKDQWYYDPANFEKDLAYLVNEGVIYNSLDDHFVCN